MTQKDTPLVNLLINKPGPWASEETIPWNKPDFSERMLAEHLSQAHDAASRRLEIVDRHVAYIHHLLEESGARILDLGCGPGLYSSRLAELGHNVTGIDFSPASIRYARQQALYAGQAIGYHLQDIRYADYGSGYDLAMLIFGEFNVFKPAEARRILVKIRQSLSEGGRVLLEPHPYAAIQEIGESNPDWTANETGLFSADPHLYLTKSFWHDHAGVATTRHVIVGIETGEIEVYDANMQAYTDAEYHTLLRDCGFSEIEIRPSLTGSGEGAHPSLFVITAIK